MHVVGLTGGIACGKSTVAGVFREENLSVIDLDDISRDSTKKGNWGYRRVLKAFGEGVLTEDGDGQIDRKKVADLVFNDKAMLSKLNRATHLPITVELARQLVVSWLTLKPVVVLDCPLLFEARLERICSSTICVSCSEGEQVERMVGRDGCTADHARARVRSQMPLEKKRALSSLVIDTSGISRAASVARARDLAQTYKRKGFFAWIYK